MSLKPPVIELTFPVAVLRLVLAMLCGLVIGYGRSRKARDAVLPTYMLVTLGAAMSVMVSLYEYQMLSGPWQDIVARVGVKFDTSRIASQVITGIGFLGAGIIIKTDHKQVRGLTTATGLFATVCLGIAAGLGFYDCLIIAMVMCTMVLNFMGPVESAIKRRLRNITMYIVYSDVDDIGTISQLIEDHDAQIMDIDVVRDAGIEDQSDSAVFTLRLSRKNHSHSAMLSSIAELSCVREVQELVF